MSSGENARFVKVGRQERNSTCHIRACGFSRKYRLTKQNLFIRRTETVEYGALCQLGAYQAFSEYEFARLDLTQVLMSQVTV